MEYGRNFTKAVEKFRNLSLRNWLTLGMCIVLLPFASTSFYGYKLYHDEISTTFENTIHAQNRMLLPLERIQDIFWNISDEINNSSQEGGGGDRLSFEASAKAVQTQLSDMRSAITENSRYEHILRGVQLHWDKVLKVAPGVIRSAPNSVDAKLRIFESEISQAGRQLGQLAEQLRLESEVAHRSTLNAIKRFETVALLAVFLAIGFAVVTIYTIDRVLMNSTDKLVEGAMRVASGDREQEILVTVPPELASVANAFNSMTRQIVIQEAQLQSAARLDGMTGLKNRREFDLRMAEQIDATGTQAGSVALLMIDVDHFKKFNDTHGHLAGDDALRLVAKVLAAEARETDEVFRYGGEEFTVLLSDIQKDQVLQAAERIRSKVAETQIPLPNGEHGTVTISIGVKEFASGLSFNDIVGQADKALYQAKASGRNKVIMAKSDAVNS
ncbi:diguanylate cyclase (GGDEF) domain-containing protein [Cohaesibacter sp. ES.047]|uniref:GGDEF domain-containing protein n=1 Tax=Cohaesibacter sp. ES.047 TaxID=1798205 RepID=UPI000BB80C63|nr:GGDEF domain-containing protein [Cohaesibacter sp. ES.047]SNY91146.1 diguanylate cyclase (GGDEF) domain-containing protein [Cohaesibacter sp. ES.047]